MKYTSEIIHEIIETEGHIAPSTFHYESECKEEWIEYIRGAYPKLTDYEGEWLNYYLENAGIGKFPYLAFTNITQATAENCVPIPFKSAILKGSTNVNLLSGLNAARDGYGYYPPTNIDIINSVGYYNNKYLTGTFTRSLSRIGLSITPTTPDKKYLVVGVFSNKSDLGLVACEEYQFTGKYEINSEWKMEYKIINGNTKRQYIGVQSINGESYPYDFKVDTLFITEVDDSIATLSSEELKNKLINGSINFNFYGMQSVKMPVLKTIGNNVFDGDNSMELGAWHANSVPAETSSEIRCKNNFTPFPNGLKNGDVMRIVLSDTSINSTTNMHVYDESKTRIVTMGYGASPYIEGTNFINGVSTVTIHDVSKCKYFSFRAVSTNTECKFAIMVNTSAPYEPYKSNILTVNEPVELRGIGDVKDTLDLTTGEMTERIGEIVLDGSEDWKQWWHLSKTVGFKLTIGVSGLNRTNSITNSLTFGNINGDGDANDIEGYNFSRPNILIRLNKTKLNGEFTDYTEEQLVAFKNYLSQNPITIQYQLETESVKTVGLSVINQNGDQTSLEAFEGTTHIQTNGQPIKPLLDIEVPVEAITQNLESFIEEE